MSSKPTPTKAAILKEAVALAEKVGYSGVTQKKVAERVDVPPSLVAYHWGAMDNLRAEIINHAVDNGIVSICAQALSLRRIAPEDLTQETRENVAKYMSR